MNIEDETTVDEAWRKGATQKEQRECDRLEREAKTFEARASGLRAIRKGLINKYAQRAKAKARKARPAAF